jgi:bifunctional ADP-heptose synthase (sugar kinase/adenylyltransferase)
MLTEPKLEELLSRITTLRIGVLGDLFLDRYLDIDAVLTEPSIETGLDAYQVVRVRSQPGAAGTVLNNLIALGVQRACPIAVIGDDGEGYELRQGLATLGRVDVSRVFTADGCTFRTPTYTKPMLCAAGQPPRELNRLDIKNRTPLPSTMEERVLNGVTEAWPTVDALLVLDQVSEADCGTITAKVRDRLADLGQANPNKLILADSRERIGRFRNVSLKPNQAECARAAGGAEDVAAGAEKLAQTAGRPVFCTCGSRGILVAQGGTPSTRSVLVPAFPVEAPIDIVGAGDSTSAGIACATAAGATLEEAAAFGNLVASITIQQIGTTGTASPEQVRQRWRQVSRRRSG